MDDRRRTLILSVALVSFLGMSAAEAQPPTPRTAASVSLEDVDRALHVWHLDEAARLLSGLKARPTVSLDLRLARLDMKRARYDAVIKRLSPHLGGSKSVSPDLRVLLGAARIVLGAARVVLVRPEWCSVRPE